MSTKLSTNEITASAILMTAMASKTANRKDVIGEVMRFVPKIGTASRPSPEDKLYEVQLLVNGVELDWAAFEEHVSEKMEAWIREAAAGLVQHILQTDVQDALNRLTDAANALTTGIEAETTRLLAPTR